MSGVRPRRCFAGTPTALRGLAHDPAGTADVDRRIAWPESQIFTRDNQIVGVGLLRAFLTRVKTRRRL